MPAEKRDGAKITRRLRDAILRLQYRPGQNLDESEISEALGVSRTPVREAIIQLIADGLVVRDGRKARVAPLDLDDMPGLYDALLISSRMIQRLAARNRTDADLAAIYALRDRFEAAAVVNDGVARTEVNQEFHRAISSAARNKYFQAFYEQVLNDTIRLSRACFSANPLSANSAGAALDAHLEETIRQHRLICIAIENRDAEMADKLAVMHHQITVDRIKAVLFSGMFEPGMSLELDTLCASGERR